jgi:WD40 repeat protein
VWVNDARGAGWEEVGELELDGAVVTAAFTDDALTGVIGAPKPSGIVTTSAGSAWLVEVTTGTARALVQSHPLNVTYVAVARVGRRDALATVSQDGTARVWDAASSAKVIEVHADPRAATRAHAVAVSPDGSHICLGCNDGSVGVVSVSSGGGGVSGSPGVQGPVKHVPAHPGGGPVMCLAFLPPPLLAPRGWGITPLLSVASDGSIALTATHANEHDGADFPTEIVASVAVTTAPHHSDPVAAAAVEGETNPALVAIARAGVLHVYAVDSVEHKAALRATYAPNASRFAALSPAGVAPAKPALVAWSASQPGVVVYCSQATAGKIVIFNVASSAVTRVLDTVLGAGLGGARCLSVVYRPGGGDVIAVGGGDGVEFVELPDASSAEEQGQGYLMHSSSFGGIPLEDGRQLSTSQPISSHGGGGLRRGMMSLPGGVDSMAWAEDGKSAWIASGNCVYVVTNPATHLR